MRQLWFKTIFLFAIFLSNNNSFAAGFIEIREKEDNFRVVKKITLLEDEKYRIDVRKIGWKSCEAKYSSNSIRVSCNVVQDKFIDYYCYGNWEDESIDVSLHGNNYLIGLKIICTNKK